MDAGPVKKALKVHSFGSPRTTQIFVCFEIAGVSNLKNLK